MVQMTPDSISAEGFGQYPTGKLTKLPQTNRLAWRIYPIPYSSLQRNEHGLGWVGLGDV